MRPIREEWLRFLLALQFLTRLPIALKDDEFSPERLESSTRYYPLVGLLIGSFAALVYYLCTLALPAPLPVLISTAASLLLTGAFHEDGLADTFDGIGGGLTREAALNIMKDSRISTYGTAALVTILLIKVFTLSALSLPLAIGALIAGHGLSRVSAVMVMVTSRYVRFEGKAKPVASDVGTKGLVFLAAFTALILIGLGLTGWSLPLLACALVGLIAGHVLIRLFYERKLGGYTGDALGATQQISEIGFYLGALAWL